MSAISLDYDVSTPYSGLRSLRGTLGAASGSSYFVALVAARRYAVRPGDVYQISAALKITSASGSVGVAFVFLDSFGEAISGSNILAATTTVGSWIVASAQGPVPSGAVSGAIYLLIGPNTTAEWDSVKLTRSRTASITYVIDGGGSVIATGIKGQVSIPANCTINSWNLTADQSGSAVVDVLRSTYAGFPTATSIAGTDKPALSSAQKNQNGGPLSAWTTALAAGDILQFNVVSCSTCTRLVLTLNVSISG